MVNAGNFVRTAGYTALTAVLIGGTAVSAHEYNQTVYATSTDATEDHTHAPVADSPTTVTRGDLYTSATYEVYDDELVAGEVPDLPPSRPGQCYALVQTPALFRRWEEQVVVQAETTKTIVHPAKYQQVQERQMVTAGHTTYRTIPARYETVTEQVLVKPETTNYVEVPAQYRTVSEQVQVSPARKLWKRGEGAITKLDAATGEILCLVEEPAQYETRTRQELVSPASQRAVVSPAQFSTRTKQVMVEPERKEPVHVPAVYKMATVAKLVEPERQELQIVPAVYDTVTKSERIGDPGLEWRSILCKTNMTPGTIQGLESALQSRGYNPGPVDGVLDSQSYDALKRYQADNGLPQDEYINIVTLESLGVAPQTNPVKVTAGPVVGLPVVTEIAPVAAQPAQAAAPIHAHGPIHEH